MLPYFKNYQPSLGRINVCVATCGYRRAHTPVPLSMEENSPSTGGIHTEIPLLPRRLLENVTTTLFQVCHMSGQALESQKSSERVF